MKFNFNLINPYCPRSKCGAEVIAAGILGGTGLLGSAFNSFSTSSTNKTSMNWQTKENEKNRDFSSSEAEKQRNWQSQEWMNQFDTQRNEWYNQLVAQQKAQRSQFDYEADYNSPANQLKRLQGIGLNAAQMFGQGGSGLISASSGNIASAPSPSPPSGGTVSGASASPSSVGSPGITAPQFDIGSLGDFLSQSVKAYSENAKLRPQIEQMWQSISLTTLQIQGQELANSFQETLNFIQNATKNNKVYESYLNIGIMANDIALKASQGKAYDAEAFQKATEAFLNIAKEKCSKQEYMALQFQVANQSRLFDANLNRIKSETNSNNAQAKYYKELADKTSIEFMDLSKHLEAFVNYDMKEKAYNFEKLKYEIPMVLKSLELKNLITAAEYEQAKRKIVNLDLETVNKWIGNASDYVDYTNGKLSPINQFVQWFGLGSLAGIIRIGK